MHDSIVLVNSTLYQENKEANWIAGVEVSIVILGDPAYPLLLWLMKPYIYNGHLSDEQKCFNYQVSRASVVVENAYGRLKGRWRCLCKRIDSAVSDTPELIAACYVLHVKPTVKTSAMNGYRKGQ